MHNTFSTKIAGLILLAGFLLGIHDGRVAIWKDGCSQPYRVIPCPAFLLTRSQQDALAAGIPIRNMTDVEKLIRDFFP